MHSHRYLSWLLLLAVSLSGCGKSGPKVAPVSGKVTLDDKPLANADVSFAPTEPGPNNTAGPEAIGRTDDQGQYSLRMVVDKRNGAVVGANKVRISLIERGTKIVNRVPPVYNTDTKLTFTVPPEGTTQANFDLFSSGK